MTTRILNELEGCSVYPSAYQQLSWAGQQVEGGTNTSTTMTADTGTVDVIVTKESWKRKARRAKLRAAELSTTGPHQASTTRDTEPLLMARISCVERQETGKTGLAVKVSWTYGMDAVKFESFAMFLLAAIERRAVEDVQTQTQ